MKKIATICIIALAFGTPASATPSAGNGVQSAIALAYIAHRCGIKLNRDTNAWTTGLVQAVDPNNNAAAVAEGERAFRKQAALLGRNKACAKARMVLKEQGWL